MTFETVTRAELFFLDLPFWIATVLLVAAYVLIMFEKIHKTVIALFAGALASNLGGTATLTGDQPNMMIASKAQLTVMNFILHLTPVVTPAVLLSSESFAYLFIEKIDN